MLIISWNVNGIRAIQKKGFMSWLERVSPDILCLQETRAHEEQLEPEVLRPFGYTTYWTRPQKKGYSGVSVFAKNKPRRIDPGFGLDRFDREGRVLLADFRDFYLLNIYFPNGKSGPDRLRYKLEFYDATLDFTCALKKTGKPVIICGDYNTAHKPIDLARPKENEKVSGFLPEERAWLDRWVQDGQVDIFRIHNQEAGQYTWWDMKTNARERNVGWRIDYHFVTCDFAVAVKHAAILADVPGSDHCPVSLEIQS